MDADDVAGKHFTPDEIATLPDLYASAARSVSHCPIRLANVQAMWAADFVAAHTMEHLQSLILLGVFMNNRDRSEAAWALLGAAIKVCLRKSELILDGARSRSVPSWSRTTSGRRQASTHVDRPME